MHPSTGRVVLHAFPDYDGSCTGVTFRPGAGFMRMRRGAHEQSSQARAGRSE